MKIESTNGAMIQNGKIEKGQPMDAVSKSIQKQIENAQEELKNISANEELTLDEKMKKRQEIQKQINDLNIQLKNHEMELRKENQKKETVKKEPAKSDMQSMIAADSAMKQAKVQGSVASKYEGRANILKVEIQQDKSIGAGGNTKLKEDELAKAERVAQNATKAQLTILAEANNDMSESSSVEKEEESKETKPEGDKKEVGEKEANEKAVNEKEEQQTKNYASVDIRL